MGYKEDNIYSLVHRLPYKIVASLGLYCIKDICGNIFSKEESIKIESFEKWINGEDITLSQLSIILTHDWTDLKSACYFNSINWFLHTKNLYYIRDIISTAACEGFPSYSYYEKMKEYYEFLMKEVNKLSELERIIYFV